MKIIAAVFAGSPYFFAVTSRQKTDAVPRSIKGSPRQDGSGCFLSLGREWTQSVLAQAQNEKLKLDMRRWLLATCRAGRTEVYRVLFCGSLSRSLEGLCPTWLRGALRCLCPLHTTCPLVGPAASTRLRTQSQQTRHLHHQLPAADVAHGLCKWERMSEHGSWDTRI